MEKRVRIFVGPYGSGKTEVAIERAQAWAATGRRVSIVDLDLVNPYFRSRELTEALEAEGITVVAPAGELRDADLPIITPQVRGCLSDPGVLAVLDVGGDDAGARALSQFAPAIPQDGYEMFFVVNDRRPWTGTVAGIRTVIRRIEAAARLRVTALVSNPNLGEETTPEVVAQGHALVTAAADELGLPVAFLCVAESLADRLPPELTAGVELVRLSRQLLPPWYEDTMRLAPYRDRRAAIVPRRKEDPT